MTWEGKTVPGIVGGIVQNIRLRQAGGEHNEQTKQGGEDHRGRAAGIKFYDVAGGGG